MTRNKIIHRNAICFDCDWRDDDIMLALKRARAHHKKTGHNISVEMAYTVGFERAKN